MGNLSKEAYQNKLDYIREYNKQNSIRKVVWFNSKNARDMKILKQLNEKKSCSEYIKNLIEQDHKED